MELDYSRDPGNTDKQAAVDAALVELAEKADAVAAVAVEAFFADMEVSKKIFCSQAFVSPFSPPHLSPSISLRCACRPFPRIRKL